VSGVDVFLSHRESDKEIAARIHDDLVRSGLSVWGFLDEGEIGVDFKAEFERKLRSARCFCALDSEAARRSRWIRREWRIARRMRKRDPTFMILPCLVQADDGWRGRRKLYTKQNRLVFVDFVTTYERAIRRLCEMLGVVYVPLLEKKADQEVIDGILDSGLDREDARDLVERYTSFRSRYTSNADDIETSRGHLGDILGRIEDLGAKPPTALRLAMGVLEAEAGDFETAARHLGRAVREHPEDPRTHAALGGALYYQTQLPAAIAAYETARDIIETNQRIRSDVEHDLAVAQRALETGGKRTTSPKGDYGLREASPDALAAAVRARPEDPRTHAARAWDLCTRGDDPRIRDYETTVREFEVALEIIRTHEEHLGEVIHNLCYAHFASGDPQAALSTLEQVRADLERTSMWHELRGRADLISGSSAHAAKHLRHAVGISENQGGAPSAELLLDLSSALQAAGDLCEARRVLRRCVAKLERDPELLRSIAEQWIQGGQLAEAVSFLEGAVDAAPESIVVRAELASLRFVTGARDRAFREAEAIIERAGNKGLFPREDYYVGMMYYLHEEPVEAKRRLRRAQDADSIVASWPTYDAIFGRSSA